MIKNYIKIAFRVMMRQKFFTAVSLFGISFTIMIFSISAGIGVVVFGNVNPTINHSKTIYFEGYAIVNEGGASAKNTFPDFYDALRELKIAERIAMYRTGTISSLKNGEKVSMRALFTDEEFWKIYQFKFLEGQPFTHKDITDGQSVAVITEAVKLHYFGKGNAIGKYIGLSPKLKVIGVIEDFVSVFSPDAESASIFIPWTRYNSGSGNDSYSALFLAGNESDLPSIKDRIKDYINKKEKPVKGEVYVRAKNIYEKVDLQEFLAFLGGFIFLVMLVPALNLIGLNINRISERSSEIGIRKAFGASSSALINQFITENIIITFLGGILGIILTLICSGIVVSVIYKGSGLIPDDNFLLNWPVIIYALAASLVFGLLSGILPAWRMSRLHAVKALKGGEL